jgi:hypothetical protein
MYSKNIILILGAIKNLTFDLGVFVYSYVYLYNEIIFVSFKFEKY